MHLIVKFSLGGDLARKKSMVSPTQDFTARNLGWMRRHRRQFGLKPDSGKLPKEKDEWSEFLGNLETRIARETFDFGKLTLANISKKGKTKQVVATKSLDEVLVLRRMNENIRRSYGIKNPNRDALLRTLQQALAENTQKNIFRLDIKSCFESISRHAVYSELVADGRVSFQTLSLLNILFEALDKMPRKVARKGLPRGLAISSTMAEIVLNKLERDIRQVPGVYVVLRYVDDLVVITTKVESGIERIIKELAANYRLKLNVRKSSLALIACECDFFCGHGDSCPCLKACKCQQKNISLEYLGYSIYLSNRNSVSGKNSIVVRLSKGKLAKIKTRIMVVARDYIKTGDASLLNRRLELLTGNLQMMDSDGSRGLSVGLSYTHSSYGIESKDEIFALGDLNELNFFMRRSLAFAMHLRPAPASIKKKIYKYSFVSGFHSKRRVKLKATAISVGNPPAH
ncbi:RNA-directed DNA polymerase [Xanthomonas campestris pv. asclepiadis]|uniref:antiviral reverse transcriptase Drt3a n=1 Tax=Xanthomonas campestris TaxID=339 RepID=UPI001E337C75|nr:antiviral reverse transcriptase Drt3a [Xanthomonas campestris]MCC4617974.1 RNA-directed DNA polymerase [Xanthomonas campestris pv. asclepiadis]